MLFALFTSLDRSLFDLHVEYRPQKVEHTVLWV